MVALCCVARNENKYLQEWVSYHLKMGFGRIYIYDIGRGGDECCDELAFDERVSVINTFRDYKKKGDVTIESYTHCYKKYGNNFRWMMFLSINEFLVLDNTNNIYDFVNDFTKKVGATQCIRFNWLCYDSNDHKTYEDKDVRLRFTRQAKNTQYNNRYECIYKCKLSNFELINAHCARNLHYSYMCDGTHIGSWMFPTAKNVTYNGGHINCYLTKSEEEYLDSNNRTPLFKSGQGLEFFNAFHDPQCQPIAEKKSATQRTQANSVSVSKGNVDDGGVSICLSAWNTQDYIEECLDSIANQTWFKTHDNWEILLGIDACEKTLAKVKEIMHKYKNLSVYMMNENVGTYVTSNTIMKLAKYKWLLRFDTDDVMIPNMVEKLMLFRKIHQPCIVQYQYCDFVGNFQKKVNSRNNARGSVFYNKTIFEKYGGYRNWRCAADFELLERLKNFVTYYEMKQPLFYRRKHNNNLTSNPDTGMKSEYRESLHKQIYSPINESEAIIVCETQSFTTIEEKAPIVSFLIVNRGGTELKKVINNIQQSFRCEKEIIVISQEDDDYFKRGQLFNIGYRYANGDYLVLMDNDIIILHPFDIVKKYIEIKKPYLPFTKVSQLTYRDEKNYTITKTELRLSGFGAFAVVSKNDFIKSNGFSNLCMNWGGEDNIFNIKINGFYRVNDNIGHITHPKRSTAITEKHRSINNEAYILYNNDKIEYDKDGFNQTTYEEVYDKIENGIRYIGVKNISVVCDYIYKDILNKHYE